MHGMDLYEIDKINIFFSKKQEGKGVLSAFIH